MKPANLSPITNGFRVQGCVAFDNVVQLRREGEEWLESLVGVRDSVEIDLSDMKDQDASSFSLLLCWVRCAKQQGFRLHFTNVTQSLQRMRNLFGLTDIV